MARYGEFVDRVRKLCRESPGAQSALRAGLGKPVTEVPARVHAALLRPGLIREDPTGRGYADKERAYYAVAALIADRPRAQRLFEDAAHADAAEPGVRGDQVGEERDKPGTTLLLPGTSLGESIALAVRRRSPDELKSGAAESRLHLLVRQDLDGAHRMLPGVFRWLGSSSVIPDYACLLYDLSRWRYGRDPVATRWLQSFYRSLRRLETAAERNPTVSPT
ncbi:type I-E CRISPR-associated protein Cse2/CasB [Streptomyces sp. SID3212]|uniref:type I-E CRISPR-associated protein Cse2/CasB n=1 Tax=Streptomyces sp. SID3212 TaxID=2690259 RepID=UPI00137029D5|nr:type I-E CRISPR-associated protein Cse2/CasB [Streptomyces sp. SID3212]MYV57050.1 type I-E CRISPR-associated protein Cse2/CasB [Streptomyces sp. SID3212]